MATRIPYPGSILSGDSVTASNNNKLPGGAFARDGATAAVGGSITTSQTIVSVAVTPLASRYLLIQFFGIAKSGTADTGFTAFISEDGTTIAQAQFQCRIANADQGFFVMAHSISPAASSHTYVGGLIQGTGSPTITHVASSVKPTLIVVQDCGPTFS